VTTTFYRLAILLLTLSSACGGSVFGQTPRKQVIVLGFDGVDANFTEKWMNEGKLPNLARLRDQGTYRPLLPTLPAQTPVSWSTFATGIDPGRTGIFDFLKRDPKTYLPTFAAFDEQSEPFYMGPNNRWAAAALAFLVFFVIVTLLFRLKLRWSTAGAAGLVLGLCAAAASASLVTKYLPLTRPTVVNRRQGIPMWEVVSKAGLKARVVHVPVTFPASPIDDGHMLAGLGVPDISARVGKPFFFTSELDIQRSGSNEFSIDVVQLEDNRGVINTSVVGPPNRLFSEPKYISTPMTITVADDRKSVGIQVGEQAFSLRAGQWSGWVDFVFPFNPLIKVRGISRFHLIQVTPEVKLYLSPINFDPRSLPPGFDISYPRAWASELAGKFGPYKTMGWAIDTWAISEGFATEQIFWDDMTWTVQQYRTMYKDFLASDDDLFIQCFEFPDRVAHVFFRLYDPQHPAYDAAMAAKWGDSLLRTYQIMDSIVGEAMQAAEKKGASLIVLSDHGFATWRKSVNYNTWLVQNGYLAVRQGVESREKNLEILFDHGQFWENVDWSKTRAYALGLGNIYINLKGREAQGTVNPGAEYEALKLEIKTRLESLVDPENGARPISRVVTREAAYRSFDANLMPDLFVANMPGYRVSWQTSLGGIQKNLFEENKKVWSGDHCSIDPQLVKGIFFYNRKIATARPPYIADIYPTVLDLLSLKAPYRLDGVALK